RRLTLHPCDRFEPAAIARLPLGLAHFRLEDLRRAPGPPELLATPEKADRLPSVIGHAKRRSLGVLRQLDALAENICKPLHEPRTGRHAAIDAQSRWLRNPAHRHVAHHGG